MVYRRKGKLYIHSESKLAVAAWIATPPYLSLDAREDAAIKGQAVRQALENSKQGVPKPKDYKELAKPLYKLSGTKTWAEFSGNAVSCDISQDGKIIRVRPSLNRGADYGFEPKKEGVIELDSPSDEEIGRALDLVLDESD
jgi:hypothetical protein